MASSVCCLATTEQMFPRSVLLITHDFLDAYLHTTHSSNTLLPQFPLLLSFSLVINIIHCFNLGSAVPHSHSYLSSHAATSRRPPTHQHTIRPPPRATPDHPTLPLPSSATDTNSGNTRRLSGDHEGSVGNTRQGNQINDRLKRVGERETIPASVEVRRVRTREVTADGTELTARVYSLFFFPNIRGRKTRACCSSNSVYLTVQLLTG